MSEGLIMKPTKAELEACYQVRRDYELAEENSGKKFHAIPVCHGDMAYVSWDAEVWLCTTIAALREKLAKAEARIEVMKCCLFCAKYKKSEMICEIKGEVFPDGKCDKWEPEEALHE